MEGLLKAWLLGGDAEAVSRGILFSRPENVQGAPSTHSLIEHLLGECRLLDIEDTKEIAVNKTDKIPIHISK